ncbi:MAG: hypothetical protein IJE46_06735 [Clostridia bacterium]|nr:hypothetical protein [Clostridia bacterium]
MIKRVACWLGFTLIRLGWWICNRGNDLVKSDGCTGTYIKRKHTTYKIEFDRQWEKENRKAKLEQQIKKHEEKIRRLQYEIDFELR